MAQVFVNIIGQNSSGKTTIAKRLEKDLQLNRISGDDFRNFLAKHILYFHRTSFSYPSEKTKMLRPIVLKYRLSLALTLIEAGQSLIYEGSGAAREHRQKYLDRVKKEYPTVKIILIWIEIPEKELLKRLKKRDKKENAQWTDMYHDFRKDQFEPPAPEEADLLLYYDQHNYKEIEQRIAKLLSF